MRGFLLMVLSAMAAAGEAVRLPQRAPETITVQARPPERVHLSVSVLDERGEPVLGLREEDFVVREDGLRRTLVDFAREADRENRPLSAVFLLDRSISMRGQLARWQEAVPALLSAMRPVDEVRLSVVAGGDLKILQDFTSDPALIESSIRGLAAESGGTSLFRAVEDSLRDLRHRPGRKALFLLTDGLDDVYARIPSVANDRYLSGLLRQAVIHEITIITILPSPSSYPFLAVQDLAIQSGGWWLYPSDDLPGLVRRLGRRLLESYHLAYDSDRPLEDTRKRSVEVSLARAGAAGWQVHTVAGVFGQMPLVDLLIEDLGDEDEERRARAAAGLGAVAHKKAADALRRAMKDESPLVRAAAAMAAGRRRDPALAGKVSKLLEDEDPAVRDAAREALHVLLRSAATEADRTRLLDLLEEGP